MSWGCLLARALYTYLSRDPRRWPPPHGSGVGRATHCLWSFLARQLLVGDGTK